MSRSLKAALILDKMLQVLLEARDLNPTKSIDKGYSCSDPGAGTRLRTPFQVILQANITSTHTTTPSEGPNATSPHQDTQAPPRADFRQLRDPVKSRKRGSYSTQYQNIVRIKCFQGPRRPGRTEEQTAKKKKKKKEEEEEEEE